MINNYDHLHKKLSKVIHKSKRDRLSFLLEPFWINYPKTEKAIQHLNFLLTYPKQERMRNLLIIGESNIGKTSLVKKFVMSHPDFTSENDEGMSVVTKTVILAESSPSGDDRGLYTSILESFWTSFRPTDSIAKLRHQVLYLMRECSVKMLMLDEIHHILSGTPAKQRTVMNAIKSLGNELKIPIVGIGTEDASMILSNDPQHASRFDVIRLPKWELDKDFRGLLVAFERRLPLQKASNLDKKEKATLLYTISKGNLGNLRRLLIECTSFAIKEDIEEITVDIIKKFKWVRPTNTRAPIEIEL